MSHLCIKVAGIRIIALGNPQHLLLANLDCSTLGYSAFPRILSQGNIVIFAL